MRGASMQFPSNLHTAIFPASNFDVFIGHRRRLGASNPSTHRHLYHSHPARHGFESKQFSRFRPDPAARFSSRPCSAGSHKPNAELFPFSLGRRTKILRAEQLSFATRDCRSKRVSPKRKKRMTRFGACTPPEQPCFSVALPVQ